MNNIIINEYIIFVIKLITIFLIPILILILIKTNKKQNKNLNIENINEKFQTNKDTINNIILKKKEYKIYKKNKVKNENKNNLFVIRFNGDIYAKETIKLKEIISNIILIAKKDDEVMLILNSSGGLVNNYGLAASQLERIKKQNIKLTVSIDLIAASGGYLMAVVADKIIASEFSISGSIGVIGQIPNFNRLLDKNYIDIEQHTSGKYKRNLTIFGKNTENDRKKFIEILEKTHELFNNFILKHRKDIDIEKISTGEYWYAKEALNLHLIDEIKTSDEYIIEKLDSSNIYEIKIKSNSLIKNLTSIIKNKIFNI